jgi:hypothetical protein
MCVYDANELNRMCDVPIFSSNEDAFFIFETMNAALILHHCYLSCVYALLGSKELGDWVKVRSTT